MDHTYQSEQNRRFASSSATAQETDEEEKGSNTDKQPERCLVLKCKDEKQIKKKKHRSHFSDIVEMSMVGSIDVLDEFCQPTTEIVIQIRPERKSENQSTENANEQIGEEK